MRRFFCLGILIFSIFASGCGVKLVKESTLVDLRNQAEVAKTKAEVAFSGLEEEKTKNQNLQSDLNLAKSNLQRLDSDLEKIFQENKRLTFELHKPGIEKRQRQAKNRLEYKPEPQEQVLLEELENLLKQEIADSKIKEDFTRHIDNDSVYWEDWSVVHRINYIKKNYQKYQNLKIADILQAESQPQKWARFANEKIKPIAQNYLEFEALLIFSQKAQGDYSSWSTRVSDYRHYFWEEECLKGVWVVVLNGDPYLVAFE